MKFTIISEEELIREALNGSEAHLNILISTHEPFIMNYIGKQIKNRQDLLELRQLVCCRIVELIGAKSYVHQDKFQNWASIIIRSEISNFYRKKKPEGIFQYFSTDALDEFNDGLLMAAEETLEETAKLTYYLERLPPEQAVVVKLKCLKDKTFREISELTGVPINTVMGRYRYGLDRIREMMT